ncbi:MAG: MFS transporter [Methylococcales bacterium]|nr:MFS transporter [Methylococcales bacterium]
MAVIQDISSPLTPFERRASISLASIYALRMFGLFMILPVLTLFSDFYEGSTPLLIGLAMSIYGLTQALFQIPFGLLSDRFGRKKMIVLGLLLFITGSVVAALSTSIYGVLIGRALQGCGAIAAVVMALAADLTQEVHRTKIMAMIGVSIGLSFAVAMVAGPILADFAGIQSIFWVTTVLAVIALLLVLYVVPNPLELKVHPDAESMPSQFKDVLLNFDLLRLDFGIFILHLVLMASFVIIPLQLRATGLDQSLHWQVYLPILVGSMAIVIPFVILAEKKHKMKSVFLGAIAALCLAFIGFAFFYGSLTGVIVFLALFFCGFNLLEATLPSLISKTAPGDMKGTAMGVYSTSQFLGAFLGGTLGGWCYGQWGVVAVFIICIIATLLWLVVAMKMRTPCYLANLIVSLEGLASEQPHKLNEKLVSVTGVAEARVHVEEKLAYLKVDNSILDRKALQDFLTRNQSV